MFGMTTGGCSSFAIGSMNFCAFAPRPTYVADLEVTFVVDSAQDLSRGAPAQMIQKRDKRGEPKLYPAPTILCPPRILGIRAEGFRGGVCAIFRSTATAVDPAAIGAEETVGGSFAESFSFAL